MQSVFDNRSFKYGDGLFETVRLHFGKVVFLCEHYERLLLGFNTLQMHLPEGFSPEWLEQEINKAVNASDNHANSLCWRVRMTFWRADGGLYAPTNNKVHWHVAAELLAEAQYRLNEQGLLLGVCESVRLTADILSPLKTTSALPYVMAGLYKTERGWDDALLLNSNARAAEAVASNIFLCIDGVLYTSALSEGPVSGICRKIIIAIAKEQGVRLCETRLEWAHFAAADEVWLTNVLRGISWVAHFVPLPHKKLLHEQAAAFVQLLNKRAKSIDY